MQHADQLVNAEHADAEHQVGHHLDRATDMGPASAELVLEAPVDPLGGRALPQAPPLGRETIGDPPGAALLACAGAGVGANDRDVAELLLRPGSPSRRRRCPSSRTGSYEAPPVKRRWRRNLQHVQVLSPARLSCSDAEVRMQLTGTPAVRRIEVELVADPSFLVPLRVALRATSHARGRSASIAASWRSRRRRGGRSSPLRGRPLGSAVSGPVPCPSEEEFAAFCIQDSRQDWSSSADHSALRLSDPSVAIAARVADPEPGAAAPDASTPAAVLRL